MGGHELYSFADGYSGYHQVRIAEEDQLKTTFMSPWGTFCYEVMPFGLCNAPATFQRLMNKVLEPYLRHFLRVFMDEIGIYGDMASSLEKLEKVFERLDELGITLRAKKTKIGFSSRRLVGHIVSMEEIVVTDHQALVYLLKPNETRRIARWIILLQEFDLEIVHHAGAKHGNVDFLSRMEKEVGVVSEDDDFSDATLMSIDVNNQPEKYRDIIRYIQGSCGEHFAGRITVEKILAAGYYWPTMFKDSFDYCKRCEICQAFANRSTVSGVLHPIPPLGPFKKWGKAGYGGGSVKDEEGV
ncbi:hypothetical protein AXG93_1099s1090 [Marchantia polymorpha subsp. ruderalis]|uniref:Reverse transcriptase domain-containing protein n=1 Tax=Marchantia polymorpha subsp. ruderalis TaxID=1480154 RepID=A0A176WM45_MARPO|nr:hypothetical protein AXG93_1099s1090 [Marchantia polymorpha subsp. ruderalis]